MIKNKQQLFNLVLGIFLLSNTIFAASSIKKEGGLSIDPVQGNDFTITSNISISVVNIPTVAVGNTASGDTILLSRNNLIDWQTITPAQQGLQLNSVASSGTENNLFVAVGNQGDVQFSQDGGGKIWNKATIPSEISNFNFSGVTYGDHTFAATASSIDSTGSRVLISSDGGKTWEVSLNSTDQTLFSIAYVQGEYVAFGDKNIYFTKDLSAGWSSQALTFRGDSIVSLAYGNNQYVGVGHGMGYGVIYQSEYGLEWKMTLDDYPIDWSGIAFGDGKFVATTKSGHIYLSTDGSIWTDNGGITASLSSISFSNATNTFVVAGTDENGNEKIMMSTDGLIWLSVNTPVLPGTLRGVTIENW